MLESNSRSLVLSVMLRTLHLGPIMPNAALALPILVVNHQAGQCLSVCTLVVVLMWRPLSADFCSTSLNFSCICWCFWDSNVI